MSRSLADNEQTEMRKAFFFLSLVNCHSMSHAHTACYYNISASHPSLLALHKPAETHYPAKLYKHKEGKSRAPLGALSNHSILSGTG